MDSWHVCFKGAVKWVRVLGGFKLPERLTNAHEQQSGSLSANLMAIYISDFKKKKKMVAVIDIHRVRSAHGTPTLSTWCSLQTAQFSSVRFAKSGFTRAYTYMCLGLWQLFITVSIDSLSLNAYSGGRVAKRRSNRYNVSMRHNLFTSHVSEVGGPCLTNFVYCK